MADDKNGWKNFVTEAGPKRRYANDEHVFLKALKKQYPRLLQFLLVQTREDSAKLYAILESKFVDYNEVASNALDLMNYAQNAITGKSNAIMYLSQIIGDTKLATMMLGHIVIAKHADEFLDVIAKEVESGANPELDDRRLTATENLHMALIAWGNPYVEPNVQAKNAKTILRFFCDKVAKMEANFQETGRVNG